MSEPAKPSKPSPKLQTSKQARHEESVMRQKLKLKKLKKGS